MRTFAALAFLSSLTAAPAVAQQAHSVFRWQQGEWEVHESAYGDCWYVRNAPDGTRLMVGVSGSSDNFLIDVYNPRWSSLVEGSEHTARINFGLYPHDGHAIVILPSEVVISAPDATHLIQGFTSTPSMGVGLPGVPGYGTPLSQAAMRQFTACITVIGGINHPH